jgi:hypothetical protein
MRLLIGLIGIPLGFYIVIKREQLKDFTGDIEFAEKRLGSGGTYTFFVLLGVLVAAGSMMYMFGVLQLLLGDTVGRLLFPSQPQVPGA